MRDYLSVQDVIGYSGAFEEVERRITSIYGSCNWGRSEELVWRAKNFRIANTYATGKQDYELSRNWEILRSAARVLKAEDEAQTNNEIDNTLLMLDSNGPYNLCTKLHSSFWID